MSTPHPAGWLTVPQVCAYLKVTPDEWAAWEASGDTPLHLVGADGQSRVRVADLARWLDARTVEPTSDLEPSDIAEWHAQRAQAASITAPPGRPGRARQRSGGAWLTIAQVCAYLKLGEEEWADLRVKANAPVHVTGPDGQLYVNAFLLECWLNRQPSVSAEEFFAAFVAAIEEWAGKNKAGEG